MIPKSIYMKLSPYEKKKVKARLGMSGTQGRYTVKGSGAYIYNRKKNPYGHYGEKIGKYLGSALNIPYARQLGAYGGHAIGKIFGSGAYYNSRGKYIPSYRGAHKIIRGSGAYYDVPKGVSTSATSPPSFGSNRTIVRHREFIGNIQGSTGFEINTWNVNPGDEATFPWLSTLAQNYEKYRPIGMIFEFKSTSANALASTNTALGTVMLAPRYNAIASSVPGSKMEMLQIENCTSICPAESSMCGIECAQNYNPLGVLYIRNSGSNVANNEQMYDFCDFYLATEGMQAVATIGELWITYEIELLTPILNGGQIGNSINFYNGVATTGISASNYMGTNLTAQSNSNFTMTWNQGTQQMFFPADIIDGLYMVNAVWVGNSTAWTNVGISATYASIIGTAWVSAGGVLNSNYPENASGTSTRMNITFYVKIDSSADTSPNGATFSFTGGTLPTSVTAFQIVVSQVPDDAY